MTAACVLWAATAKPARKAARQQLKAQLEGWRAGGYGLGGPNTEDR